MGKTPHSQPHQPPASVQVFSQPQTICSLISSIQLPKTTLKGHLGLHGNPEMVEEWQLNAAAPHLILTPVLTEQIMGNNTPLCCREMKCFSRCLSHCEDLLLYSHRVLSHLPLLLTALHLHSILYASSLNCYLRVPVFALLSFLFHLPSFSLQLLPHIHRTSISNSIWGCRRNSCIALIQFSTIVLCSKLQALQHVCFEIASLSGVFQTLLRMSCFHPAQLG